MSFDKIMLWHILGYLHLIPTKIWGFKLRNKDVGSLLRSQDPWAPLFLLIKICFVFTFFYVHVFQLGLCIIIFFFFLGSLTMNGLLKKLKVPLLMLEEAF